MDICIVGAGPAGSSAAYEFAKLGHQVEVYEKQPEVGSPVQCTGILSDHFSSIMKPSSDFIENTVKKTRIHAPDGNYVETKIKKNYIVCRKKFDTYLADRAKEAGATYNMNSSFKSLVRGGRIKSRFNLGGSSELVQSDVLIGADGPISHVAKSAAMYGKRKHIIGTQLEIEMENDNVVDFYPYIGCYAWIVPKNDEVVRVGVAAYKDSNKLFKEFIRDKVGNYEEIENQSGVIPLFNPLLRAQKENIYLTGDAAAFVKATTGGGINQSLRAGKILADSIHNRKNYDLAWRKSLFSNLYSHLISHNIMQKFSTEDWNELTQTFSEPEMKKILYDQSRDKIPKMLFTTIRKKPSMLKYLKYLF